jgi:aminoglycoside phosphotransferase (APT) family kinase protein
VKVDTSAAKHQREWSVLSAAGHAGIPVPAIVFSDARSPALLVLRRVDGSTLDEITDRAPWRDAGRCLRLLHGLAWPTGAGEASWSGRTWSDHFRWWADHERDQLLGYRSLPAGTVGQMHEHLRTTFAAMAEPEPSLLHGDCQVDHYLVEPRSSRVTGILDFGDAVLGDPVWDLAVLTLGRPRMVGEILDGYRPDATTERRIHDLLPSYQLIRLLGSAAWRREHGQPDAADLDAASRIFDAGL